MDRGTIFTAEKIIYTDGNLKSGFEFLQKLEGMEVEDYDKKYTIKLPVNLEKRNIAWSFLYFTGFKKKSTRPAVFFLVVDWESSQPQFLIDRNGNADFTDDSTQTITKNKWFLAEVVNSSNEKAKLLFQLILRDNVKDSFLLMLHKGMSKTKKNLLPSNFVVFEKAADCRKVFLPDSNIITLVDATQNGLYNDKRDKIIAGDVKYVRKYDNPGKSKPAIAGELLAFPNTSYRVNYVDKYGQKIGLTRLDSFTDSTETLPEFGYIDEADQKKRFIYPGNKISVFYFWGSWCIGCHQQSPMLARTMQEHKPGVDFFTFNSGDKKDQMTKYIKSKDLPFQAYRLDYRNSEKLKIESFPTFLVVDEIRNVLLRTTSVLKVDSLLKKSGELSKHDKTK